MIEQPSLFAPIIPSKKTGTIDERWLAFHEANGHVLDALIYLARLHRDEYGSTRLSVKYLFEVLRFRRIQIARSDEPYYLNNDFTALYARKMLDAAPDLAGLIELRERRSA